MGMFLTKRQIIESIGKSKLPEGSFTHYALLAGIHPEPDAVQVRHIIRNRERVFYADGYPLDSVERIRSVMPNGGM